MSYYFNKVIQGKKFEDVIESVTDALKSEGFGVLTDIDVKATFKKKIDIDFRNYRILGACNPQFAHKAITKEDKIGVFLPCNVIVQELEDGNIEVAAVDPVSSMSTVKNDSLAELAQEVQQSMKKVVAKI